MRTLTKVFSYVGVFTLGIYATSQFKFDTPIDTSKWLITSFATIFLILNPIKNK